MRSTGLSVQQVNCAQQRGMQDAGQQGANTEDLASEPELDRQLQQAREGILQVDVRAVHSDLQICLIYPQLCASWILRCRASCGRSASPSQTAQSASHALRSSCFAECQQILWWHAADVPLCAQAQQATVKLGPVIAALDQELSLAGKLLQAAGHCKSDSGI